MTEDRRFYVYVYFRLDGTPLYVGKGCGRRWLQHQVGATNTNIHFQRVLAQEGHGIPRVRVREHLTNAEAQEIEIALIAAIGRVDNKTGPLVNMTPGGDGRYGYITTEETKALLSQAHKGRVHSDAAKRLMSEARKGVKKTEEHKRKIGLGNKGKKLSEDTKNKQRAVASLTREQRSARAKAQHAAMTDEQKAARAAKIAAATKEAMARPDVRERFVAGIATRPAPVPPPPVPKGTKASEETRQKQRDSWAARKAAGYVKPKHTAETRAKMSASQQRNAKAKRDGNDKHSGR